MSRRDSSYWFRSACRRPESFLRQSVLLVSIHPQLLEILVCPETKEPVTVASQEILNGINNAVERGTLNNRSGEAVKDPVTEGLVRADGEVFYPVRDGIPIMLIDESIDLTQL